MNVAFLTEMRFNGRIPENHVNMRTEMSWMACLQADHYNIHQYELVKGYDAVLIIFPKATVKLNAVGVEMVTPGQDTDITIYSKPIVETLKKYNKKVCYIQEGPCWFFNDYDIPTQFNWFNQLSGCDVLFTHNTTDIRWYKGLFPNHKVDVIPTLMYDTLIRGMTTPKENRVMIGGNFARWYGGFQSYLISDELHAEKWIPSSHCKRQYEDQIEDLHHLPYVNWFEWMAALSKFKYAVHLMPTVAAGTFSMNCAYFGIPCVGNINVDTQYKLFPDCSVDVENIKSARDLVRSLYSDQKFYDKVSTQSKELLHESIYFNKTKWLTYMMEALQ